MIRHLLHGGSAIASVAVVLIGLSVLASGQSGVAASGDWPHWGGDLANTKYSPLAQITPQNVKSLLVAWRWKADNFGPRPDVNYEATPLAVNGVLYTVAGSRRDVVAIDGATGETLWMFRMDEGERGDVAPRKAGRGLEYWVSPDGRDRRLILVTQGFHMVELDAATGRPVPGFGTNGVIDMYEDFDQPIPKNGLIGSSAPPVVVRDVIVAGNAMLAGTAPPSKSNVKGYIRGWDVRTGKRLWTFHTIPQPGEFGNDTWLGDSWSYSGNTGAWVSLAADEALGYVYLPLEGATGDFYGGHRPGNNLFADSLVCLDAKTGKRVWHYQIVHHDIWDFDIASPPTLIDITVGGRRIQAVAQATKQSYLYVFDRVTGTPVWPIEEKPVPRGDTPGEWYSPTQPIPTHPPPYDRQGLSAADLNDWTPELRAEALELIRPYRIGPLFTPPTVATATLRGTLQIPGNQGSANWQGISWDPETSLLYVPSVTNMTVQALQPGGTRSDMTYIGGAGAVAAGDAGGGTAATAGAAQRPPVVSRGPWGIGPQGLPLVKPPYGRITAYDMNRGEIVWQVANGESYEWIKTHPALGGLTIPKTGRADEGGVLVTKTLAFAGMGCGLFRSGGGGAPLFYAYDKKTGDVVHEMTLPAGTCGNPMTYLANGNQYIAVAIGSRTSPAELIALALP